MEYLINVLKLIEKIDYIEPKDYLTNGEQPELVKEAVKSAEVLLITENGRPNTANMEYLRSQGFDVFPGKGDSFGWLTGCIRTTKGIIVFG